MVLDLVVCNRCFFGYYLYNVHTNKGLAPRGRQNVATTLFKAYPRLPILNSYSTAIFEAI